MLRYSSAMRNFVNEEGGIKRALANGEIRIYQGTQPASANAAPTGTLLVTITNASAARTKEVQAVGSLTISGTLSGSVDTVTVNGLNILGGSVAHTGAVDTMAAKVAAAINNNPANALFVASAAAGVVTLTAKVGLGALPNTWAVSATFTTTTAGVFVDMAGGVNAANGLRFADSAAGVLARDVSQNWTGVGTVGAGVGTAAGWFRFVGAVNDPDALDEAERYLRLDGSIASSGADLNLTQTSVVNGATQTINGFNLTMPASA